MHGAQQMDTYRALYYPSWDPPASFLRAILLFYDGISVIVPKGTPVQYCRRNAEIIDRLPGVLAEIEQQESDIALTSDVEHRLNKAFGVIAGQRKRKAATSSWTDDMNCVRVDGYTLHHSPKTTPKIREMLKAHRLWVNVPELETDLDRPMLVDADASQLIIGILADQHASSEGLRTITDRPLSHLANALEGLADPNGLAEQAEDRLASLIISMEVPATIGSLSLSTYLDLRDQYAGLRESFHRVITEICRNNRLRKVQNPKEMENRLRELTLRFSREADEVRHSLWLQKFRDWIPVGLTAFAGVSGLTGSLALAGLAACISVGLQVHTTVASTQKAVPRTDVQRMLGCLRRRIESPTLIERFLKQ